MDRIPADSDVRLIGISTVPLPEAGMASFSLSTSVDPEVVPVTVIGPTRAVCEVDFHADFPFTVIPGCLGALA